ncbi:serine hydrolase [Nocardia sp. NPDC058658]|uniref:serine hydrolase n=1 Tax=Nocardia sp. NPDC058658 TaxID=3346580 RepID=UPI0036637D89
MRFRPFTVSIFIAALILSACMTSTAEPLAVTRADSVRADLDAMVGTGAVGAIATLTESGTSTVVAAGSADRAAATPIATDVAQHVRVGSITKSFTAAIVLQLVAERRVDLDRSVENVSTGTARR